MRRDTAGLVRGWGRVLCCHVVCRVLKAVAAMPFLSIAAMLRSNLCCLQGVIADFGDDARQMRDGYQIANDVCYCFKYCLPSSDPKVIRPPNRVEIGRSTIPL